LFNIVHVVAFSLVTFVNVSHQLVAEWCLAVFTIRPTYTRQ